VLRRNMVGRGQAMLQQLVPLAHRGARENCPAPPTRAGAAYRSSSLSDGALPA
jgi:hypothetical protein